MRLSVIVIRYSNKAFKRIIMFFVICMRRKTQKNHSRPPLVRYGRSAALESAGRQPKKKIIIVIGLHAKPLWLLLCGLIHRKNKWGSESKEYIEREREIDRNSFLAFFWLGYLMIVRCVIDDDDGEALLVGGHPPN